MPPYRGNPLDESVNTELMRVCKCVIPYLDRSVQKNVAVGVKFLELINTINAFSDASTLDSHLALTRQGNWQEDLLHSVRSSLSPEKAYLVDAMIKLQECKSILNVKESEPSPSFDTPTTIVPPPDAPNYFGDTSYHPPEPEPYFEKPRANTHSNSGPSPAGLLQALSPMLDDSQKQLLTLLSTFMTNK